MCNNFEQRASKLDEAHRPFVRLSGERLMRINVEGANLCRHYLSWVRAPGPYGMKGVEIKQALERGILSGGDPTFFAFAVVLGLARMGAAS